MKVNATVLILFLLLGANVGLAQQVVRLYSGAAPGSESWTHEEKEYFSPLFNNQVVTNVSQPTLTVFTPEAGTANGTSVIVCPGGGFHALSIDSEGTDVAKWLNGKGVTAFVLRYRLVPTGNDGVQEMMTKGRDKVRAAMTEVFPLASADGLAAVRYVPRACRGVDVAPDRIGIMGFSAGGSLTTAVALNYAPESRPNFVAPIYAYLGVIGETSVPADAPPMFLLAASDDQLGLAGDSINLYSKWLAAQKPVELHMYSKGGHGFGMKQQNLPSDQWIERFGEWLQVQGLLAK